ncbi:MAG TPA: carboxypeptidase-like regulatory domain-containing protein [Longimicrobium sp.]|nr:carboxypeptidase-like regulatory domain-containing protein [Longimicrobium sp.]
MKTSWGRSVRKRTHGLRPADAAQACALGILLLAGVAACETVASPEITPAHNVVDGGSISGQVLTLDGRPVPSALLRAGSLEAVTDAAGFFRISGLPATRRLAVNVEARGYDATTAIYEVRAGVDLSRPIRVQPLASPVVISAGQGGAVPIAGGGQVVIPGSAFAVPPTEQVTVRATYIDTQDPAQFSTAPGDFTARTFSGASVQLESFGMLSVDVRDAQGQPLDLAPGQQATIQFPLRGGTGPATRPLWTFDTQQGIWVEEGSVTVTQTTQDATVSTLAPRRNVDVPFPPVCISVRVLRADKVTPRPNQFVSATGISYAGATQGWTNGQGVVQLQVRSASQVLIQSGPAQQPVTTPPPGTTGCPLVATLAF